jgi:hypothetical protein
MSEDMISQQRSIEKIEQSCRKFVDQSTLDLLRMGHAVL